MEGPFQGLLQNLDAIIWQADAATLRCTFVNRRVVKLLGYSVEEWMGDPEFWMSRLHPEDREGTLALCLACSIDGKERQSVHRALTADGRVTWFRTTFRGAAGEDGQVREIVGMMVDISEHVKAISTLEESEARMRLVLEQGPLVLWTTDRELRYTSSTGAGLAKLGLRPYQLTGISLQAYLQTDDPNHPQIVAHRRALAGEPLSYDGDWGDRTFQNHVEPFRDADGRIIGTLGIAFDVTERKQAERDRDRLLLEERAARAASEIAHERAAFLAEASAVLSSSLDYEATLGSVARLAVPRLADWSIVDTVEGDRAIRRVVVHQQDPALAPLAEELRRLRPNPAVEEGVPRVLRTGQTMVYAELGEAWLRREGDHWSEAGAQDPALLRLLDAARAKAYMAVPLIARGKTLGALTFLSTEDDHFGPAEIALGEELGRRAGLSVDNARLYQDAREAVRLREEFLSVASHELRTPVTSLLLGVQSIETLLRSGSLASAPATHVARLIESTGRQARRMADLVDALLDVSRIQAGRFGLALDPAVDLAAVARDVAARLEPDRGRAGSALTLRAGEPVVGRWDRSRLDQVVTNLLSNAIKFGAGKPIDLEVGGDAERATLVVRDQGIGIPRERHGRIFEIFERAVSARHYGGLGLGLYIVRRIVDAHGGAVEVTSAPGEGATFTVSLPRSGPASSPLGE